MSYKYISQFGSSINNYENSNPLSYCLFDNVDSGFDHGPRGIDRSGKYSANCQSYMSSFCAENSKNGVLHPYCEFLSKDEETRIPNSLAILNNPNVACGLMTFGDVLIQNTAAKKYLVEMGGACKLKYSQFDPTVANSPYVHYWGSSINSQGNDGCVPVYEVNPHTIDNDPIMNKILDKPYIGWNILVNIYNTAVRKNKLHLLKGTKLYIFFHSKYFQKDMLRARKNRFW